MSDSTEGFDGAAYGEAIADTYDRLFAGGQDAEAAASTLADLAGDGRALELGVGTGRVAIPLAMRGVEVFGIDISPAMLQRLCEKPGGDAVKVVLGDFEHLSIEGEFELIYAAFSSFFGMVTQEAQVRCFRRVSQHLEASGAFVIEAFVPDPSRYGARGRYVGTTHVEAAVAALDVSVHDLARQTVRTQHVLLEATGNRLFPSTIRYAWPSELDLMALLAGLRLRDRWSDWGGAPFTSASRTHVSVYERRATTG